MKTIRSDEEAVSPVIGVILMVAIVVILAAVIAAFVFGMAGSTGTTKTVAVIVSIQGTSGNETAIATWEGGVDLNKMESWKYTTDGGTAGANLTAGTPEQPDVGQISDLGTLGASRRVILTGYFSDGSEQVIYDRQF